MAKPEQIANAALLYNAGKLKISTPAVFFVDQQELRTQTMIAALSADGKELAISNRISDERTIWLAVSHEMRHLWQMKNHIDFGGYKPSEITGKQEYNEQEAEIDAHAWAFLVLQKLFGVRPNLESIGKGYVEKILKRMSQIRW